MNEIRAVLFDLDNTILDRTLTFAQFTHSFLATYFSHSDRMEGIFARIIELDQDGYKDKQELFAELLDELPWRSKPALNELLEFYRVEYVKNAVLMDEARKVLSHMRRKYLTGLITNGRTDIQYGKIDRLGIRDEFDVILVSEEAGVKKPDPRIFNMALDRLRLQPRECVFVGDHPSKDINGAAQVGMKTIWIQVNQRWPEELRLAPNHTIRHLTELLEVLHA